MAFLEGGLGETIQKPRGVSRVARYKPSDIERKRGQAKRRPCDAIPKNGFPQYDFSFSHAKPFKDFVDHFVVHLLAGDAAQGSKRGLEIDHG